MPSSPLQVVLNTDNFVRARETSAGGQNKDFFGDQDSLFATHRDRIRSQLTDARSSLLEDPDFGGVAYAKVTLQRSAYAKSHRPTEALFTPVRTPVVGSESVGQIIVEVTPEALDAVTEAVDRAEPETRRLTDARTGKEVLRPTRRRSEVGAIEQIDLWTAADKRAFSAEEAVHWLSDSRTGGAYRVHIFEFPAPRGDWDALPRRKRILFQSFLDGLTELGPGLVADVLEAGATARKMISVRLNRSTQPPLVQLWETPHRRGSRPSDPVDGSVVRHEQLLRFLDRHPLVRSVDLPPRLIQSPNAQPALNRGLGATPRRQNGGVYPRVGIIDGGVSTVLAEWVVHRWGLLADGDRDEPHGTFIAGLLVGAQTFNPTGSLEEPDGCELVDIDIFPTGNRTFAQYYPNGISEFFDEVEQAVADCRSRFGVRVFNLSINAETPINLDRYSVEASRLDRIADAHDVLIVISAGNLSPLTARREWDGDHDRTLVELAAARNDGILIPAESIRNLSVAALNPLGHAGCVAYAPASYSRRGPGLRTGVKPDVAHVGGAGRNDPISGSGLNSCAPDGSACSGSGTSYAAPLVAKTLAALDAGIEGTVSRETLTALLVHHSFLPVPLQERRIERIARDLAGFGLPACADQILSRDDHEITLVFANRLRRDQEMAFDFSWPASLVRDGGRCRGDVRLTLVATPPLDYSYGAEFVRVNVFAALQQEDGSSFKGRLHDAYLPPGGSGRTQEMELIEHALKWSPTKIYRGRMPNGVGRSSRWRLLVKYLTRAGEMMPADGVPFSVILTIGDPDRDKPVFNEMRQALQAAGVVIADIQIAARVTSRI